MFLLSSNVPSLLYYSHFIAILFVGKIGLIVQLVPKSIESSKFWISYPREVLDLVRQSKLGTHTQSKHLRS